MVSRLMKILTTISGWPHEHSRGPDLSANPHSSAAERPMHAFARRRRLLELTAARLIVVRMLEDVQELVKGT